MWRVAVVAFTLASAPAAAQQALPAPQITAEEAMATYRATAEPALRSCPQSSRSEEVIVCARVDENRYRAPLYAAPDEGPATRAGGEQRDAMAVGSSTCTPVGRAQRCSGGLPIFAIVGYVAQVLVEVIRGDD